MALVGARRAPESVVCVGAFRVTFAGRRSFGIVRLAVAMPTVVIAVASLWGAASAQGPLAGASGANAAGIVELSATSSNNNVASTLSIPVPSGVSVGDVLLASLDVEQAPTITIPAGWTLVRSDTNGNALHLLQADYVHSVSGTDPANYTWTFSAAHGASGGIVDYTGVDTAHPIDVSGGQSTSASTTRIIAPTVTTTLANDMLLDISSVGVTRTLTPPSSMTQRYTNGSSAAGEKTTIIAADQLLSAAGATGSRTTTADSTSVGVGQLVALRPAPVTDITPPSTPGGLSQASSSTTTIGLSWSPSTDNVGVAGYTVYENNAVVTTSTATSFVFSGLACGSTYSLGVDAFDAAGNRSTAATLTGATNACTDTTPPSAPTGLAQTGSSTGSINVSWNASTDNVGVTGYTVFQTGVTVGTTTATSYSITGLACGTSYNISVDAFDAASNHSAPVAISASTASCPILPQLNITAPSNGATVSGNQTIISATATDAIGIASVQFMLDGAPLGNAITSTPYSMTWDTTTVTDGPHKLTAVATDTANNTATSAPVSVTVSNGSINTPPTATVTLSSSIPDTDSTLTASATATDSDGDTVSLTYVWQKNGATMQATTTMSRTDTYDLSKAGLGNYGDIITVKVTPNDGVMDGSVVSASATVTKPPTGTVIEYGLPTSALPSGITQGLDGNLWFSLEQSNSLGYVTPGGVFKLYTLPSTGNQGGINPGPDGNIWFTENTANKVSNINPATGVITRYSLGNGVNAGGIVAGADGNMWFLESSANKIGRITMSGNITLFNVPTAASFPHGLNPGPDGNIWFNEYNSGKVGKITPSGAITEYRLSSNLAKPDVIIAGPDGNMWFTEDVGKIGRITTSGKITEFKLSNSSAGPVGIVSGPDSNLWFTEKTAGKVGRITTSGIITEFSLPSSNAQPDKIVNGPDGNLWFTEHNGDKIGRITP